MFGFVTSSVGQELTTFDFIGLCALASPQPCVARTKPRWQLDKRSFALDRKRKAGREIALTPSALEDYAAQEVDSRIPNGPGRYGGSG